ncbi:MAG TPA: FHIPEP family type III secretion protein [Blastocatellia bacterium]|nr:FHIPEP family type III secretion protein [Blastocatellia bacterium]
MIIPSIPIEVLLGDDLKEWADEWNPAVERLRWHIETELRSLLDDLGIPGKPVIEIRHESAVKNLRLLVRGSVQTYSVGVVQRLAEYFSDRIFDTSALKSSWGRELVTALGKPSFNDFLTQLIMEIVKQNPDVLLGDEQVNAYLKCAGELMEELQCDELSKDFAKNILSFLLSLRLSIKDSKTIIGHIVEGCERGRSEIEMAETLTARLSSNRIEVVINRDYLSLILDEEKLRQRSDENDVSGTVSVYDEKISGKARDLFKMMADGLFYELGMRVPDVVLTAGDNSRESAASFKINDIRCPARLGIKPDQLLVNASIDQLKLLDIEAERAINPANDNECSLINKSDEQRVADAGLQVWDLVGYLILALSRELRRNAGHLLHIEKVEYDLAQLDLYFPELVNVVMEKTPLARLTQVLRELQNEGISIKDMKAILECVVSCDYLVFDGSKHIVFDDRLVFHTEPSKGWRDDGHSMAQRVRAGLKRYISHKYTLGKSTLIVYLIDPRIEKLLLDHLAFERGDGEKAGLSVEKIEKIREAIRDEVGALSPTIAFPAILTVPGIRFFLRGMIANEYPDLPVLSFDELSPDLNIQPIARISLKNPDLTGL